MSTAPSSTARRTGRRASLDSSCLRPPDQKTTRATQRRCSFTTISVREYDQTLGDHPSCQDGPPLTLGWKYAEQKSVALDDFESRRKNQRRKSRDDLLLGAAERRKRLVLNGATMMEILQAERMVSLKNTVASMVKSAPKRCARTPQRKSMVSRAA